MGTSDARPSHNGRGSDACFRSWTHLRVDRRSTSSCRVTFDHPPTNTITETTVAELAEIVALIEQDPDYKDQVGKGLFKRQHRLRQSPRTEESHGCEYQHAIGQDK